MTEVESKIPIDLICDVQSPSGYSAHARELIRAIHPLVDLRIEDHKHDPKNVTLDPEEHLLFAQLSKKTRPAKVRIQFETPEFFEPQPGVINIGYTQWETTRIVNFDLKDDPRLNWVTQMNRMDHMWSACEMACEAFRDSGVETPCHVLRGPIDVSMYKPGLEELPIADLNIQSASEAFVKREHRPVVLGMVAQWTIRKNIPALLVPILSRFTRDEVTILLKTYGSVIENEEHNGRIINLVRDTRAMVDNSNAPRVVLLLGKLTDEEVARLYASMDIYVNTSRGEGFCMPVVQAMSSGVVPVSCGFSAPADYIDSMALYEEGYPETLKNDTFETSDGVLVPYTLEPAVGMRFTPWYRHDQDWAAIDQGAMVRAIRQCMRIRSEAPDTWLQIQKNAREKVVSTMSHGATGLRALELIEDALERRVVTTGA